MDHTDFGGSWAVQGHLLPGRKGFTRFGEHPSDDILLRGGGDFDLVRQLRNAFIDERSDHGADSGPADGGGNGGYIAGRHAKEGLWTWLRHLAVHRRQYLIDHLLVRIQPSHHEFRIRRGVRRRLHRAGAFPDDKRHSLGGSNSSLQPLERVQPSAAARLFRHILHSDLPAALFSQGELHPPALPGLQAGLQHQALLYLKYERHFAEHAHFQLL